MAVLQVLSILVALGMSGYAVLVTDTTESNNSSNLDGHEIHSWSPSSIGNEWLILD